MTAFRAILLKDLRVELRTLESVPAMALFAVTTFGSVLALGMMMRLIDAAEHAETLGAALSHGSLNVGNALGAWLGGVTIAAGFGYRSPLAVGVVLSLAGFAVLMLTTAPGHERLAFVFFVLQLGLLSSQIWTSTFGEGRSLIEPYLMALVLLVSTPRRYLSWPYLGMIAACVLPALAVVARRRILYM